MEKMHYSFPRGRELDPSLCHTSKALMIGLSLGSCFAAQCPSQAEYLNDNFA